MLPFKEVFVSKVLAIFIIKRSHYWHILRYIVFVYGNCVAGLNSPAIRVVADYISGGQEPGEQECEEEAVSLRHLGVSARRVRRLRRHNCGQLPVHNEKSIQNPAISAAT